MVTCQPTDHQQSKMEVIAIVHYYWYPVENTPGFATLKEDCIRSECDQAGPLLEPVTGIQKKVRRPKNNWRRSAEQKLQQIRSQQHEMELKAQDQDEWKRTVDTP